MADEKDKNTPVTYKDGPSTFSDKMALARRRPKVKFDSSSMTSSPDKEAMSKLKITETAISIASNEVLECIKLDWVEHLKVPSDQIFACAMDIVMFCVDNGASAFTKFEGRNAANIPREDLAATIKQYCTLRQFCSKFAPIAWNYMLSNNRPPASWARRKLKASTKFAAFDFIEAVNSPAALQPSEGLIREPTDEEMNAANTLKDMSLQRDEMRRGTNTTFFAEVTGGKTGARSCIKSLNDQRID